MSVSTRAWTVVGLVAAVTVLLASVAWTLNGATLGRSNPGWPGINHAESGQRGVPSGIDGSLVDVVAMDMGGHGMMGRSGAWASGTMLLRSNRVDVPAGTVTLQLYNGGGVTHELVILPLADGKQVGERSVGQDGSVDESDSLGEASPSGSAGSGDDIDPGTTGWVTVELAPGQYEMACNIENHYAAGMYTLLVVS